MIHALVKNDPSKEEWFLSCVYGTPYKNDQPSQWRYIQRLSTSVNVPWALLGDLNITMNAAERNTYSEPSSTEILEYIKYSDLHDLGYSGNMFTWISNSHGTGKIKSRLDRSLVNSEWMLSYPNTTHLPIKGSDHAPILLTMYSNSRNSRKCWKFFEHWLQNDACKNEILSSWKTNLSGSTSFLLIDKLSNTRCILSKWSKATYRNIQAKITLLQEELPLLQASDIQGNNTEQVKNLEIEIDKLNEIQASSNMQKSKDHFYNHMDRNSKYFHTRVNHRRDKNKIDSLLALDGSWYQHRASIESLLITHFKNISTTSQPTDCYQFFQYISSCITDQDNEMLARISEDVEIYDALMKMKPWTSPGPDGFPPGFYQTQWQIVKDDVCKMVKSFFSSVIALRLKQHMVQIISPMQSAYVPGRLISENICLVQELVKAMKKKGGRIGPLPLKMDMSKAFDRLEWVFLDGVLKQFGFCDKLCHLIHQCINDCLLFCKANLVQTNKLLQVIEDLSACSGQLINFHKSVFFFNKNTSTSSAQISSGNLQVRQLSISE
ncbi:uncharacterized protein LOC113324027 [Papaver somniferum]|uniref:uncharacterized protein LOC113324027 n=1 Tax=Papaver somniferum TaxID=3469 RepID=UPI000E702AB4|nr:uncharacterized protein LOC113324027 [Papaver somniferum]